MSNVLDLKPALMLLEGQEALPAISHAVYIASPIEKVWEILTTADGWDSWFTCGTTVDARVGGTIMFRWNSFGPLATSIEDGGPILSISPPTEFSFQWTASTHSTIVKFTLEKRCSGTILNVSENGFLNCFEDLLTYAQCAAGWGEALTLLKYYLEHRIAYGTVPD